MVERPRPDERMSRRQRAWMNLGDHHKFLSAKPVLEEDLGLVAPVVDLEVARPSSAYERGSQKRTSRWWKTGQHDFEDLAIHEACGQLRVVLSQSRVPLVRNGRKGVKL